MTRILCDCPRCKTKTMNVQIKSVFFFQRKTRGTRYRICPYPPIEDLVIKCNGVQRLLERLSPNKGMGPDALHQRVFKHLAPEIAPILAAIFNKSLQSAVPGDRKRANVTPDCWTLVRTLTNCCSIIRPVLLLGGNNNESVVT